MKQRDLLKGRVKRLLRDQKDMGQVGESAVVCSASAVQIFVRDLATKMQKQAAEGVGLTPVELKKAVLASRELNFLHEKVSAIDESDAKYHKPARGGKKRAQSTATKKPSTKKARTTKATKSSKPTATTTELPITKAANERRIQSGVSLVKDSIASAPLIPATRALEVEEDDNYDESDSDA
ncbi:hypothetical protein PRIC2_006275 [Phytophthora ramorum]